MRLRSFCTRWELSLNEKVDTFEYFEICGQKFVGFFVPEGEEVGLGLLSQVGVLGLKYIADKLQKLLSF